MWLTGSPALPICMQPLPSEARSGPRPITMVRGRSALFTPRAGAAESVPIGALREGNDPLPVRRARLAGPGRRCYGASVEAQVGAVAAIAMPIELTAPVDVVMNTFSPGLIAPGEIEKVTPSSPTRTPLATAVVAEPDTPGEPAPSVSGPLPVVVVPGEPGATSVSGPLPVVVVGGGVAPRSAVPVRLPVAPRARRLGRAARGRDQGGAGQAMTAARTRTVMTVLAAIGLAISAYLTYVHYADLQPFCTGISDCERVQTSDWALVAGVPVALIGLLGYIGVLVALRVPGE